MRQFILPSSLATLALAASLLLGGCSKSSNQQSAQPAQPAAAPAQPAAQPPASTPQSPAGTASASSPPQSAPPPPPQITRIVIPAGTRLRVRLDQDLGSKISQAGETFVATIASGIVVDGQTIIPRGARAEGTVIDAKPLGRFKGGAQLALRLARVHTRYGSYAVATSTMEHVEKGKGRRTAGFVGGGGALGAIIGGIAGGGKGALVGGLAGAGAGAAGTAMTGNRNIFLPAETLITFRLEHPVHITVGQ